MKIHLLSSSESERNLAILVSEIINNCQGPLEVEVSDQQVNLSKIKHSFTTFYNYDEFNEIDSGIFASKIYFSLNSNDEFPFERKVVEWDEIFRICNDYRLIYKIPKNEYIVLLAPFGNSNNWFSATDLKGQKVGFVQTSDWQFFIDSDLQYPIAYEVASMPFQSLLFQQKPLFSSYVHMTPIGCISDVCKSKEDIKLKMRTGDICDSCFKNMLKWGLNDDIITQMLIVFETIRKEILFKRKFRIVKQPSRLKITGHLLDIHMTDMANRKINFNPWEKTIFLLHMIYPLGLDTVEFCEKEVEISKIYKRVTNITDLEKIEKRIRLITTPGENVLSVKRNQLNTRLSDLLDPQLAHLYQVKGPRNQKKNIEQNRNLVSGIENVNAVLSS